MAQFIQIIEMSTANPDAVAKIEDEWFEATTGTRTARRSVVCRDRNQPDHYVNIVFFDSYESAMENSSLPETSRLAKKMADAVAGPMVFRDLDVVNDRS